jgi:transcription elongation factor Elf1
MEHYFFCPYCGEEISFILDPSVTEQEYIEDCEVCCNPIRVKIKYENEQLIFFEAEKTD